LPLAGLSPQGSASLPPAADTDPTEALRQLPPNGSDEDYKRLQERLNRRQASRWARSGEKLDGQEARVTIPEVTIGPGNKRLFSRWEEGYCSGPCRPPLPGLSSTP
jgi:hypothetical protein